MAGQKEELKKTQQESKILKMLDEIDFAVNEQINKTQQGPQHSFFVEDVRHQTFYQIIVDHESISLFLGESRLSVIHLDKLQNTIEAIDEKIEHHMSSHIFFKQSLFDKAAKGDPQSVQEILTECLNDHLRRDALFEYLEINKPQKKAWFE